VRSNSVPRTLHHERVASLLSHDKVATRTRAPGDGHLAMFHAIERVNANTSWRTLDVSA